MVSLRSFSVIVAIGLISSSKYTDLLDFGTVFRKAGVAYPGAFLDNYWSNSKLGTNTVGGENGSESLRGKSNFKCCESTKSLDFPALRRVY